LKEETILEFGPSFGTEAINFGVSWLCFMISRQLSAADSIFVMALLSSASCRLNFSSLTALKRRSNRATRAAVSSLSERAKSELINFDIG